MALNLCGTKIGRLTVIAPTRERSGKSVVWKCKCRCGNENALVSARDLLHSSAKSKRRGCGACQDTKHPLYCIWRGIISRCEDKGNPNYPHYGGRGIKICDAWRDEFLQFVEDMGPRQSIYFSVDRIDVNGNYEPGNCRWADALQQTVNRRPITHGLTDEQIIEIFTSKLPNKELVELYPVGIKAVENIKRLDYSTRASHVCMEYIMKKVAAKG